MGPVVTALQQKQVRSTEGSVRNIRSCAHRHNTTWQNYVPWQALTLRWFCILGLRFSPGYPLMLLPAAACQRPGIANALIGFISGPADAGQISRRPMRASAIPGSDGPTLRAFSPRIFESEPHAPLRGSPRGMKIVLYCWRHVTDNAGIILVRQARESEWRGAPFMHRTVREARAATLAWKREG